MSSGSRITLCSPLLVHPLEQKMPRNRVMIAMNGLLTLEKTTLPTTSISFFESLKGRVPWLARAEGGWNGQQTVHVEKKGN